MNNITREDAMRIADGLAELRSRLDTNDKLIRTLPAAPSNLRLAWRNQREYLADRISIIQMALELAAGTVDEARKEMRHQHAA